MTDESAKTVPEMILATYRYIGLMNGFVPAVNNNMKEMKKDIKVIKTDISGLKEADKHHVTKEELKAYMRHHIDHRHRGIMKRTMKRTIIDASPRLLVIAVMIIIALFGIEIKGVF